MPPRDRPSARPRRVIARRKRGKGIGFDLAGNTKLSIELRINGRLDKKIDAVNIAKIGRRMRFKIKNSDVNFVHNEDDEYIDAFKKMFLRLENNGR